MNPTDLIFNVISQMTGGLIADLSTAIIAMVMLSFIAMGFDLCMDVLGSHVQTMTARKQLTGRFTVPKVSGDLRMTRSSGSSSSLSDFTNRPSPVIGSLRMEKDDL